MEKKKMLGIALIVVLAVSLPSLVIAGYVLTSNHKTGIVNTLDLILTANDTNVYTNDILMLIAQLNNSKSGISIQFFNGTTALNPTVLTDSSGKAVSYYNVADSTAYDLYAKATFP